MALLSSPRVSLFTPTKNNIDSLLEVEKLAWGNMGGENTEASREKILLRVESFSQGVTLATVEGKAAGSQYAFLFSWDGNINELKSWDEHTCYGWTNKIHTPNGNTGFMVGVGVVPEFRSVLFEHNLRWHKPLKISQLLIARTLDNLFAQGAKTIIANARIPDYHTKSELSVKEYCALKREDGLLYDRVLRFHKSMGAETIKPVAFSMEDPESLNGGCWVVYNKPFAV